MGLGGEGSRRRWWMCGGGERRGLWETGSGLFAGRSGVGWLVGGWRGIGFVRW